MANQIDPAFLALPLREFADAALGRARELGAEHADFRLERIRTSQLQLHDGRLEGAQDSDDTGFAVRVVLDGTWGFAAGVELTTTSAARVAELADEEIYPEASWISAYDVNPFHVADADKVAVFADWSSRLLAASVVSHVDVSLQTVQENKFYADLAGTSTTQQRVRIHPELTATSVDAVSGEFETMRTLAAPVGRG